MKLLESVENWGKIHVPWGRGSLRLTLALLACFLRLGKLGQVKSPQRRIQGCKCKIFTGKVKLPVGHGKSLRVSFV